LRRKNEESPWRIVIWDDYDFHEDDRSAGEDQWDYRVTDASFTDWLKRMLETDGTPWFPGNDEEQHCKTLRVLDGETQAEVLHRNGWDRANFTNISQVEDAFSIVLPEDFLEFHRGWNQKELMLGSERWMFDEACEILTPEWIFRINREWRKRYGVIDSTCNLLRFGSNYRARDQYFSLQRKDPSSPWEVAFTTDKHEHRGTEYWDSKMTDVTFADWLRRIRGH
jgi:hypothetical protein